jgi:hypothetical protein
MDKNNAHLFLPLVKALAEGKMIQWESYRGQWTDMPIQVNFIGDPSVYRIKPEPKRSLGYRRYLHMSYLGAAGVALVWELPGQADNEVKDIQCRVTGAYHFIKWIDTEWQYAEYEDTSNDA